MGSIQAANVSLGHGTSWQAASIATLVITLWWIYTHLLRRSLLDNIPGPPPNASWLTGHLQKLFDRRGGWEFLHRVNSQYGQVVKIDGIMGDKWLYVYDPTALHYIIVKDQHIFEESAAFLAINQLMFGNGLLATLGDRHRKQRKLLNPVFSTTHMRHMLPIFYEVTDRLRDAISHQLADGPKNIDMLEWMSRGALELVGQGGFGHSFDDFTAGTPDAFGDAMKSLGPTLYPMVLFRALAHVLCKLGPARFRRWVVDHIPYWRVQKLKEGADVMHATACGIFNAKKAALEKGEEIGENTKDIMSKLLQANMMASEEDRLPDDEVIGQVSTLVFAAMDTTSSALGRILHLLSQHPDVQERLRHEISSAKRDHDGAHLSYDALNALPYLEAVCRETLRLYPPLMNLAKTARKDAVLPLSTPIRGRDGTLIHEIAVPKNTNVMVAILASNRNPALWGPDSDEWKPERWLDPLPEPLTKAHIPGVYSNLMTFLGGGRSCIGFKFSQMEMKVVLCMLMENFKLQPATGLHDEVVWNVGAIQYPSVGFNSEKPSLPLRVELTRQSSNV